MPASSKTGVSHSSACAAEGRAQGRTRRAPPRKRARRRRCRRRRDAAHEAQVAGKLGVAVVDRLVLADGQRSSCEMWRGGPERGVLQHLPGSTARAGVGRQRRTNSAVVTISAPSWRRDRIPACAWMMFVGAEWWVRLPRRGGEMRPRQARPTPPTACSTAELSRRTHRWGVGVARRDHPPRNAIGLSPRVGG